MNMKYDEEKYRLRTIKHDEKYLRQTSSDVLKGDPDLKQEIEILSNYCRSNGNLMALASVQIGIPKKNYLVMSKKRIRAKFLQKKLFRHLQTI